MTDFYQGIVVGVAIAALVAFVLFMVGAAIFIDWTPDDAGMGGDNAD